MAKAMLILDDMPESCTDCRLCMHIENFGMYCPGLHEEVLMDTFDRCPLMGWPPNGLTEIKDGYDGTDYVRGVKEGWNDAIKVLKVWVGDYDE